MSKDCFSILIKIFFSLLVQIGSFFTRAENVGTPVEVMAQNARMGSRKLQSLSPAERAEAINFIADALVDRQEELLRVNKKDLAKVSYFLRFAKDKYASLRISHFDFCHFTGLLCIFFAAFGRPKWMALRVRCLPVSS